MSTRVTLSRALRVGFAAMLLATLISGTTLAKAPSQNLRGTATAVPGTVSAGALVRFDYSVTNISNSNYSSFFVDAITPAGGQLMTVLVDPAVDPSNGTTPTCTSSGDLHCTFGPLNGSVHATATVSVLYRVPADATGSWTVTFNASSNGFSTSDPGNSHGDTYSVPGTVNIGAGKAGGTYIYGTDLSTQNDQKLGKGNAQSSKLVFNNDGDNGFPATVDEASGSSTTYVCPPGVSGTCFGDWNLISANNGAVFPGGYTLTLGYNKISGQQGNVRFVHLLDPDGDGIYGEGNTAGTDYVVIPSYNSQPCSTSVPLNCINRIYTANGNYYFELLLDNNGPMRGI